MPEAEDYLGPEAKARVEIDKQPTAAGWVVERHKLETPWTKELWVYDLRTNQHFTLKENPLCEEHLVGFVEAFHADDRAKRQESDRFRRFIYEELMQRDKASLDVFWLRDDSLEDTDNLPAPRSSLPRSSRTSKRRSPSSPRSPRHSRRAASPSRTSSRVVQVARARGDGR